VDAEVKEAWESFLRRIPWTHFLTVTFRTPRPPNHGASTLREVGRALASECEAPFFLGTELHANGSLHVHGLLKGPDDAAPATHRLLANLLWERLRREFGRSQVRRVRDVEAATSYCVKYVVKELTEWDMRL